MPDWPAQLGTQQDVLGYVGNMSRQYYLILHCMHTIDVSSIISNPLKSFPLTFDELCNEIFGFLGRPVSLLQL